MKLRIAIKLTCRLRRPKSLRRMLKGRHPHSHSRGKGYKQRTVDAAFTRINKPTVTFYPEQREDWWPISRGAGWRTLRAVNRSKL